MATATAASPCSIRSAINSSPKARILVRSEGRRWARTHNTRHAALGGPPFKIALKLHVILDVRRRDLIEHSRMFTVSLHVEALTHAHIGTACTSPSHTYATIPPMVSWARRRVPVIGNIKHLHTSPDAQFTDAAISRDFTPIPVFKWPFFRVHRRTRRSAVNGRTAYSGMLLLLLLLLLRRNRTEGAI
jgi:hypothetical protein